MAEVCYFSCFKSKKILNFWTFINVQFWKIPNTLRKIGFFSDTRPSCSKNHFTNDSICYDNFFNKSYCVKTGRKEMIPNDTKMILISFQILPSNLCY